ncbi:MAG: SPFH domain-containing protein, partial [Bacteroidales bacterium]|nr:SPFH domain-containing protein [Bacteroidales bacterium]
MDNRKECEYGGLVMNGFLQLFILLAVLVLSILVLVQGILFVIPAILVLCCFICFGGFIKLEPNEATVLVFFGKYSGTFTRTGFYWVNPFLSKKKVSLRARNLNPEPIKVNDKAGNPIMIGMVLVWKLEDTYKALFEIDSQSLASSENQVGTSTRQLSRAFENFVRVQSDAALRQVAGFYAYDNPASEDELTLRSSADEINEQLVQTLNDRLSMAGI